ncbi:hypothetical protein Tco_1024594 [Tanacetum coccineum]
MELLKNDYPIQQLQQSYRGDILRKRPHDDHQDNHQHEGGERDTKVVKGDMEIGLKLISDVMFRFSKAKRLRSTRKLLKIHQPQEARCHRRTKLKCLKSLWELERVQVFIKRGNGYLLDIESILTSIKVITKTLT